MPRNGYAHLVHDYYVSRFRDLAEERQARLTAVRTRRQALAYQEQVQEAIHRAFAPLPRRTPLAARSTGVLEDRQCRVEKVLFESRPGCLVTGHLYLPRTGDGPFPGVLGTCGHSEAGKLEPRYQEFCRRLAAAGFAVFLYDPLSQGERDQYWGQRQREGISGCCQAHNMMGKQLELVGEWFGSWRAWDGIRALDYLLSRPEVDPDRIGLTGNSGGGTMSTWLWAVDPRFTMAAPSCFVTTFLANLENELPADCEQYPPGVVGAGLELADFLIAGAPKPVLLLGQRYDFFDRRGLRQAHDEVARFYGVLGADRERCGLFIGPEPHGFSRHNQEAMAAFFAAHAGLQPPRPLAHPEILTAEAAQVTRRGSTVAAGAIPVPRLIAERAAALQAQRGRPTGIRLCRRLAELLALPERGTPPHYRVLRPTRVAGSTCARYAVETEREVRAILHKRLTSPERAGTLDVEPRVILGLPHLAAEADLAEDQHLIGQAPLYCLDVRGLGESLPDDGGGDFFHPYGMDYMLHGQALLLGESYLGRRVHDLLAVLDLFEREGAQRIDLYGRGQGAIIALCAAVLDRRIRSLTLKNAPLSWQAWTEVPVVAWPAANGLRGVLRYLDLPDLYRTLGPRVRVTAPWGPDLKPLTGVRLQQALAAAGLKASLICREPVSRRRGSGGSRR
ncbi:MAG: prolyl oligopeptidase family serine peptidase [Candidatus Latescibacterota bacterium]|jgi:cephalosporin-C deacetylase-like acetyl esterase